MEPFDPSMSLSRPYLIRAIYQWVIDNNCTPYLLVDCSKYPIDIPYDYIHEDEVVLNISPMACGDLLLGDDEVSFNARFKGIEKSIFIKIESVKAIYAKENNQGLSFYSGDLPEGYFTSPKNEKNLSKKGKKIKPSLKIVK